MEKSCQAISAETIDRRVDEGWEWGVPVSHAACTVLDVYDDTNGEGFLHRHNIPSFWATRAVKR